MDAETFLGHTWEEWLEWGYSREVLTDLDYADALHLRNLIFGNGKNPQLGIIHAQNDEIPSMPDPRVTIRMRRELSPLPQPHTLQDIGNSLFEPMAYVAMKFKAEDLAKDLCSQCGLLQAMGGRDKCFYCLCNVRGEVDDDSVQGIGDS